MAKVEFQKVDTSHDGMVCIRISDFDQDEEDEGDEEEKGGKKGEGQASACRGLDCGRRGFDVIGRCMRVW